MLGEARLRQFFYGWMGDGVEPLPRLGIAEHAARKGGAVEVAVGAENAVAKSGAHSSQRFWLSHDLAREQIGIDNGIAEPFEIIADEGFS